IPQNLKEIQRGAFVDCAALTDMTLPASVTKVCEEAFTGCTGLTSLTIQNPDLAYEAWGLEELPNLTVNTPEGSAAEKWASELHSGDNVEDYDE
ncbi:MAG: leucine-rich repeat protein, partial [Ruminococcus sp.]|nr:leucine-rich repeat protein [Ruminococcus sp.]